MLITKGFSKFEAFEYIQRKKRAVNAGIEKSLYIFF